jgi:hypothetical protein
MAEAHGRDALGERPRIGGDELSPGRGDLAVYEVDGARPRSPTPCLAAQTAA